MVRARTRQRRVALVLVAVCLTLLTWPQVAGHQGWEGDLVFKLTPTHGFHYSDAFPLSIWAVGVAACGWLWRRS